MEFMKLQAWESKLELAEYFKKNVKQALWVGLNAESPKNIFSILLQIGLEKRGIGIISSGLGINPVAINLKKTGIILIGHDALITAVNTQVLEICFTKQLDGCFYDFFISSDRIIAIHEIGVICIDFRGEFIWNINTDIIENFKIDGSHLILKEYDNSTEIIVDIKNGLKVQKK